MASRPTRIRWNTRPNGEDVRAGIGRVRDVVEGRIWQHFPATFGRYEMGAEQARTRAAPPDGPAETFLTSDGMHSEMAAIDAMLTRGAWRLTDDGHVETSGRRQVDPDDFETEEPHCRFCSIFLALLGLPIRDGAPTTGNYNYAGNLTYPLPPQVADDPLVLGRLLSGNGPPEESLVRVRQELAPLINARSDSWVLRIDHADGDRTYVTEDGIVPDDRGRQEITWDATAEDRPVDVGTLEHPSSPREYLWRLAFKGIYEARV